MDISSTDALIILDVQNDFCPGGTMPVMNGELVAAKLTLVAKKFIQKQAFVLATQEWHPEDHSSFFSANGQWPDHCIQLTSGADFHESLQLPMESIIVKKGKSKDIDAYSGFVDSKLRELLLEKGIARLFIGGLATDTCVLNTVIDAINFGYPTHVLTDAVAAYDIEPGDGDRALHLMHFNDAELIRSDDLFY